MGFGVLDDKKLEHVPGTASLEDDRPLDASQAEAIGLKCDRSGKTPVVLVPQPSDDPNDPLNWPLWQRDLILCALSLLAVLATTASPLLAADTLSLSLYFHRTFTSMALLTGYHLLGVAIAGILCVPSARIWGKRHLYLLGSVLLVIASAWGGASGRNYRSLFGARMFQGFALAPFEALVNASVGDLYCVHERGKRMALSNLALFGGAFFTPVIVGKIASTLHWQWTFYFISIFSAVLLPVSIFFIPETAYRRDERFNIDTITDMRALMEQHMNSGRTSDDDGLAKEANHHTTATTGSPTTANTPPLQRDGWRKRIRPFNGRKTDESFFKLFLRPFPLFLHPGILWACLIQGTLIGWTVMIGVDIAAVMLGPPLFFNELTTGYMYTGAFVGALIGFLLAGLLADSVPRWMAARNGGIYEPEFRMVLVIPQLILGCAGLYGFGIVCQDLPKYGWFWPDFFFALEVAGMVLGAVAGSLYIVDAHRDLAVEAFTCMIIFKNIFSFALTFKGYDWLVKYEIKKPFIIVGSVQVVVCCSTVLIYVFGKKNRSFWARHDILKMLGLR